MKNACEYNFSILLYIYIQNCTLCILYKLAKEIVIDG